MTYDSFGNIAAVQGPLGAAYTAQYWYDADRELVGVVSPDPDGAGPLLYPAMRYTYNSDGLLILVERGTVTSQTSGGWAGFLPLLQSATGYDALDRKIYEIAASSGGSEASVRQYAYDAANRLLCSTARMNTSLFGTLPSSPLGTLPSSACTLGGAGPNGNDRITQYGYDYANRVTSTSIGVGGGAQAMATTLTYSNNGLVKTLLDGMANLTTNTYDGFDRLVQVNYPVPSQSAGASSSTDYEAYTYDPNGNVLSDRRRDGTSLNYCFDALNRQIRKDFPGSTSSNCALTSLTGSVFSSYDLLNRLTSANYNSTAGPGISYAYDALSRKVGETSAAGTLSYQYDLAGDLTQITWPDSVYASYTFDVLGRVATIKANGTNLLATYTYDNLGHRTAICLGSGSSTCGGNGASTSYSFDTYGRLTNLTQSFTNSAANLALAYGYNPESQIVSRTVSNSTYTSHPSAVSKGYATTGVNRYSSVSGTSYSYDARQNLTSDGTRTFTYDSENRLLTGSAPTAVTLTYDPLGRLQTSTASASTTTYLYAGTFLAAEYNGGAIIDRYVPGPETDEPLVWYQGSGTANPLWLPTDEAGSVVGLSDGTGTSSATYGYGPSGEPSSWAGPLYSYTGQLEIPQANLYYYKARVYDPIIGRFLQTDPTGYAAGMNLYTYTYNDPINLADTSGTDGQGTVLAGVDVTAKRTCTLGVTCYPPGYIGKTQQNFNFLPVGSYQIAANGSNVGSGGKGAFFRSHNPDDDCKSMNNGAHQIMGTGSGHFTVTVEEGEGPSVTADLNSETGEFGFPYLDQPQAVVTAVLNGRQSQGGPDLMWGGPPITVSRTSFVQLPTFPGSSADLSNPNGPGSYDIYTSNGSDFTVKICPK